MSASLIHGEDPTFLLTHFLPNGTEPTDPCGVAVVFGHHLGVNLLKKLAVFGIAVALTSAAVAGQAFAADQEIIVDGTVIGGHFDIGGVKTAIAPGTPYQEIFEVDVADLALSSWSATGATADPIDSISITLEGTTLSFAPSMSTVSYDTSYGSSSWQMSGSDGQGINASFDVVDSVTFSNPYTTPVSLNIAGNPDFTTASSYEQLNYKGTDLILSPASVFPEPSMWALMIGGVAVAGLMLRRKPETGSFAATVAG